MFSSNRSTSVAETAVVGEIRRLCGAEGLHTAVEVVEVAAEHVVTRASSVGSGILQAAPAAE